MKIKNLWKAPDDLGEYGVEIYKRIGPKLVKARRLADIDFDLFVAMCGSGHLAKMALLEIERDGLSVDGGRGVKKKHPSFAIYKTAMDNFVRLSSHFGLSPMSRNEKFEVMEKKKKAKPGEKDVERFFKAVG